MNNNFSQNRSRRWGWLLIALGLGIILFLYLWPWLEQLRYGGDPRPVTPRGELAGDEQSTIALFRQAAPSVVYITTLTRQVNPWTRNVLEIPQGTGSGFIWDEQGHIVTNFHVLQAASSATVTLSDHNAYSAALVGASPDHDLAVLRISAPAYKLRPLAVGVSHDLQVGQKVFAIGNPFGLDQTLTTGIISALGRTIEGVNGRPIEGAVQTDAAINPGNSGGPLLDSAGRLIGVNTSIYSPSGAFAGIGFAVPVDTVNRIVPRLIAHGRYVRPQLGIVIDDPINREITRQLGVEGLVILGVRPGSAAAAAGLRGTVQAQNGELVTGDIIQLINGKPIRNSNDLFSVLEDYQVGDTVTLTLLRDNSRREIKLKLEQSSP
jgi:S1-C subfamily serine protease